jgi:hypothetical protein
MKKILSALTITISLATAPAIAAEAPKPAPAAAKVAPAAAPIQKTNPNDPKILEARKSAFTAQEKEWNAKTKEQKLEFVNKQREVMIKNMNDSWAKMTDDAKVAQQQSNLDRQKKLLGL